MTARAEPAEPAGPAEPLLEFLAVMRRLRAECGWKRAQTHRSLARYLLEETHETLEAIDVGEETGDWSHLREELGDLLLQVYFHAVVAEERGAFWALRDARDGHAIVDAIEVCRRARGGRRRSRRRRPGRPGW